MNVDWRTDAPHNLVQLVVGRCLISQMDYGRWIELGLLTGTSDAITGHSRLLRSLSWGDDDYEGCVLAMTPIVLGAAPVAHDPTFPTPPEPSLTERFPHLEIVCDFLDLPAWLAIDDPVMFDRLIVPAGDARRAMPDGTVISAAEAAAARLDVSEMRRQVERIRRDHVDDPEAAVGQAKELIETVCKTIVGLTGDSPDTKEDLPKLVARTLAHIGLDPAQATADNVVETRAAKRLLGGVTSVLNGAGELRNARGTGHGRSGIPVVDAALARFAVGVVLPTVLYLIEIYEAQTDHTLPRVLLEHGDHLRASAQGAGPGFDGVGLPHTSASERTALELGLIVEHGTFGEGQVVELEGEGTKQVAGVNFGGDVGIRRVLVAFAGLRIRK